MKLHVSIDLGSDPDCEFCYRDAKYSYDIATGTHEVVIWGCTGPTISFKGSPGELVNILAPYRHVADVRTLVAWLSK